MIYLKDISATEVGGDGNSKVEVEVFRYENWEGINEPVDFDDNDKSSLSKNLAELFKNLNKQMIIKLKEGEYKKPDIFVELSLSWEECHRSHNEACNEMSTSWVESCDECPHHHEYNPTFVNDGSKEGYIMTGDQSMPLSVLGAMVKGMPRNTAEYSWEPTAELRISNLDTGTPIIYCEDVGRCKKLVIEIDTTEVRAIKETLKEMGLVS